MGTEPRSRGFAELKESIPTARISLEVARMLVNLHRTSATPEGATAEQFAYSAARTVAVSTSLTDLVVRLGVSRPDAWIDPSDIAFEGGPQPTHTDAQLIAEAELLIDWAEWQDQNLPAQAPA